MKAYFALGCFWCSEDFFRQVKGVKSTTVGFMGGSLKNPTYEQVSTGTTGHAETIEVEYDPKQVTYKRLLEVFWKVHDPTQKDRQGPDYGTQYRSIIFYSSEEQKEEAIKSMKEAQKNYDKPIVTEIVKAGTFYPAEEYHQDFYQKHKIERALHMSMFHRGVKI